MELRQKEVQRIKVIENAVERRITVGKAAEVLKLSELLPNLRTRIFLNAGRGRIGGGAELPTKVIKVAVRQGLLLQFGDDRLEVGQRGDAEHAERLQQSCCTVRSPGGKQKLRLSG